MVDGQNGVNMEHAVKIVKEDIKPDIAIATNLLLKTAENTVKVMAMKAEHVEEKHTAPSMDFGDNGQFIHHVVLLVILVQEKEHGNVIHHSPFLHVVVDYISVFFFLYQNHK